MTIVSRMFYLMTDSEDAVPVEDWEQIGSALAAVTSRDTEFVVLSKDLDGDEFIQTSLWNPGMILRPSYIAEISTGGRFYRMKTKDFNSIYSSFRAYYDGWDPVVTKWEDVTDELSDRVPEDVVVPRE